MKGKPKKNVQIQTTAGLVEYAVPICIFPLNNSCIFVDPRFCFKKGFNILMKDESTNTLMIKENILKTFRRIF